MTTPSLLPFALSAPLSSLPIPRALAPLLALAYPLPADPARAGAVLYAKGARDAYTVAAAAVGFTVLRELVIRAALTPFAYAWLAPRPAQGQGQGRSDRNGAKDGADKATSGSGGRGGKGDAGKGDKAKRGRAGEDTSRARRKEQAKRAHTALRFAEQGWSLLYCSYSWGLGAYILARTPARFSPEELWGTYPYTPLPALDKFYYLTQLGWWLHQVYVLNTEKRRSDHWQMFAHHIVTITLVVVSYATNYTRIGVVVHTLMDFCDIWLPLAKMFRYLNFRTACDLTFVVFLVGWFVTRQIGLALVIRSIVLDLPRFIPSVWAPARGVYAKRVLHWTYAALLSLLLVMCSVWLYTALRVALRVLRGQGAEDERSDDEDDEDDGTLSEGSSKSESEPAVRATATALDAVPQFKTEKGLADEVDTVLARAGADLRRRK
ncbi:Sphingosine N-acyltransferase lag1 [Cryptotrichosporon argae]